MVATSSLVALYEAVTWLKGLSGCFSNSLRILVFLWSRRRPTPLPSFFISSSRRSSYLAYAAGYRRSGCRSTLPSSLLVRDKASRALSIPEALMSEGLSSSSCERSRPRAFLTGAFDFLGPLTGLLASSSASRAAFSAFFFSASAAFAAAASLRAKG